MSEQVEQLLARQYQADLEVGDGRTILMRCVPYNEVARVADPPDFIPYDEEFLPGAFARATKAPSRVLLDFEHDLMRHGGMRSVLGRCVELEERDDGLYGAFRVMNDGDGDKALALVNDGVLSGASVYYKPLRNARSAITGAVQRVKAHLDAVSLCRVGSWERAEVLAVRSAAALEDEDEPPDPLKLPLVFPPELAERLKARVNVPDGLLPPAAEGQAGA